MLVQVGGRERDGRKEEAEFIKLRFESVSPLLLGNFVCAFADVGVRRGNKGGQGGANAGAGQWKEKGGASRLCFG